MSDPLAPLAAAAGSLTLGPALERPELLATPVQAALQTLPPELAARCAVAAIDPELADTAAFCAAYGSPLELSVNCVVVTGSRSGEQRWAACLVPATLRADVNGVVRKALDVRKASFASQDDAVAATGMAYGGITPFGRPAGWRLLLDPSVAELPAAVVGSGLRTGKLVVPGSVLAALPDAEALPGLGRPAP